MPTKTRQGRRDSSRKGDDGDRRPILSSEDSHERSGREEGSPPVQLTAEQTDQFEQLTRTPPEVANA